MASSDLGGNINQSSDTQHDPKKNFFVDPNKALILWQKFAKDLGRELTMDEKAAADMGIPPKGSMPEYSVDIENPQKSAYEQKVELKHNEENSGKKDSAVKSQSQEADKVGSQDKSDQQGKAFDIPLAGKTLSVNIAGKPRGMDEDPNYKQIKEFLKTKWLKDNDEKDFENEKGKEFLVSLNKESEKIFRDKFPELSKQYDQMEKTRIYEDPNLDPAIKNLETRGKELVRAEIETKMSKGVNPSLAELQEIESKGMKFALEDFITYFPEKAAEYAKTKPEIKDAIEAKKKGEEEKKKLVGSNSEEIGKTKIQEQKQERYSGPPRGMDEDPDYQRIIKQLLENGTPEDKSAFLAAQKFRQENPDLYEKYQEMEKTRIYEDPQNDPAIQDLEVRIADKIHVRNELRKGLEAEPGEDKTIRDEVRTEEYNKFIRDFPEKAHGYASSTNPRRSLAISDALKKLESESLKDKSVNVSSQTTNINDQEKPQNNETEEIGVNPGEIEIPFRAFKDKEYQKILAHLLAGTVLEAQEKGASDISDEKLEETEKLALSKYYAKFAQNEIDQGITSSELSKDELFDELLGETVVVFEKEGKTLNDKELLKRALTSYLIKKDLMRGK